MTRHPGSPESDAATAPIPDRRDEQTVAAPPRPSKRRSGELGGGLPVADPRPQLSAGGLLGSRCDACGFASHQRDLPWCAACYGPLRSAIFASTGTVWAATVIHIPVAGHEPPFALAYCDVDDGPRVLVHLEAAEALSPGTPVELIDDGGEALRARALGGAR